jgi:hypothetical protein
MKSLTTAFLLLFICSNLQAQSNNEKGRISYARVGLFYETSKDDSTDYQGNTLGFELFVNPTYVDYIPEERFNLGWSLNLLMGWNITRENLGPYRFDIGIWGGYLINDFIEVGAQYCFLGAYAYQDMSFFGSSLSPAVKVGPAQLIWYRAGSGAFYGWFIPKYHKEHTTANGLELTVDLFKGLLVGCRLNTYEFGEIRSTEFRVLMAINFGEYYNPKNVRL